MNMLYLSRKIINRWTFERLIGISTRIIWPCRRFVVRWASKGSRLLALNSLFFALLPLPYLHPLPHPPIHSITSLYTGINVSRKDKSKSEITLKLSNSSIWRISNFLKWQLLQIYQLKVYSRWFFFVINNELSKLKDNDLCTNRRLLSIIKRWYRCN